MKLRVLEGAKKGAEIPLKRSKFLVGRSSECNLRAGSEAISRRHCVLLRTDEGVTVRDLGSRNGTHVNGRRIDSATLLAPGDKLRVGPLEFVFEDAAAVPRHKNPTAKSVADGAGPTAAKSDTATVEEDDISRWLVGPGVGAGTADAALRETQTFRTDETHTAIDPAGAMVSADPQAAVDSTGDHASDPSAEETQGAEPSGKGKKKQPGKLPPLPAKPQAKDSCEAAADVLRELARRR